MFGICVWDMGIKGQSSRVGWSSKRPWNKKKDICFAFYLFFSPWKIKSLFMWKYIIYINANVYNIQIHNLYKICFIWINLWKWKSLSRVWLCDPMDYTVHGILQARILEWVAFPFSRGSSQPRNWTRVSCIAGRFFTSWANKGNPTILEWVAYPFSSRSSRPRNWTGVSCIAGGFFTNWAINEATNTCILYTIHKCTIVCSPYKNIIWYISEVKWSEVAQSCPTLCDHMDSSLHQAPPSMGFSRQEVLEWVAISFSNMVYKCTTELHTHTFYIIHIFIFCINMVYKCILIQNINICII